MVEETEELARVRLPKKGEIFGEVIALVGGSRVRVDCADGKERMCRIPGKIRKRVWVKEGDVVLVKPWEIQSDQRGDIVWRYTQLQVEWLKRKGYLK